ncbi:MULTISPECIES: ComEA family DNA-binding protein [Gordonibacter]|uniref:ComEA family DNA-binding protein n=1 Tax=Gordonibacter faecis TaxID=3047475 RepID=A0ABT7DM71_9ACTN|nr:MULTISPECIES: ComEA family DNA-binding protein [unclassified Gordonibacter]MDJ1649280.1 ComEA family DNA-binding protein [Gordonibacter sp. KGMB12511]HIW75253.1 ComEA family DNA-binding protein [Candidatus Gordonibacter avicola]
MSFQESAESWRAKLHLSGARLPVLVGLTAVVLVVVVCAGGALLGAATADGFAVERTPSADQEESSPENMPAPTLVRVHVGGAVITPGVYDIPEGARVQDAVDAAGGFAEGALRDGLNLARKVEDGEQIIVPVEAPPSPEGEPAPQASTPSAAVGGKININRATAAELDTLPGVGASTADKIVADREANGPFKSIEDLKRVSGIGDKKFANLADKISVG